MLPDGFWTYGELSTLATQAIVVFLAVRALKYGPVRGHLATPTLAYLVAALVQVGWLWGSGALTPHDLPLAAINALLSAAVAGKIDDLGDPSGAPGVTVPPQTLTVTPAVTTSSAQATFIPGPITIPAADSVPNTAPAATDVTVPPDTATPGAETLQSADPQPPAAQG